MKRIRTFKQLNEKAVSLSDLKPTEGIVIEKQGTSIWATIIRKDENAMAPVLSLSVIGYGHADIYPGSVHELLGSAAEHGYGPMVYDAVMMSLHPQPLMPSREDIMPKALSIWKHYHDDRPDVQKMYIQEDDVAYQSYILMDTAPHFHDLEIYNCMYYQEMSDKMREAIARGETLCREAGFTPKRISNLGSKFFNKKYFHI